MAFQRPMAEPERDISARRLASHRRVHQRELDAAAADVHERQSTAVGDGMVRCWVGPGTEAHAVADASVARVVRH